MEDKLLVNTPSFNIDYFITGQAVRVYDNVKKGSFDGLIISRDKDRIGIVKVKWASPMTGSAGYEPSTEYFYVQDIVNENYTIERL